MTLPFTLTPHAEVALDLGITEKQLDWLRYKKKIRGYKVAGTYRYSQEQIADYLAGIEVNKKVEICPKPKEESNTPSEKPKTPPTGTSNGPKVVNLNAAQLGRLIGRKHRSSMQTSS